MLIFVFKKNFKLFYSLFYEAAEISLQAICYKVEREKEFRIFTNFGIKISIEFWNILKLTMQLFYE